MSTDLPAELMLRTVLDALPARVFWKDLDSRILGCNRQFADDAGAAPVDLIGKTNFDFYPPAQADAYRADDLEVIHTGQPKLAIEEPLLLSNGETAWVETNKMPLRNMAGEIIGILGTYRDVTERHCAEDERMRAAIQLAELKQTAVMALHDALTGLPNRRYLEEKLRESLVRLNERPEERLAVVALDLDRFKTINDLYGRAVGDELLRNVARLLSELVGVEGFVARVGGDEFILLLAFASDSDLTRRLCDLIARFNVPWSLTEHQVAIDVTLGVATTPADGGGPDFLMRHADMALHCAKLQGCGRVVRFEPAMESRARERALLDRDLRIAIRDDRIIPYFQPIVELTTGEVVCYEVLARWRHAERGLVQPEQFIKIATDAGLIGALTINVLRRACREITAHCPGTPRIAINIAPVLLRDATLPQKLLKVLSECGFQPARLAIEITEDALVSDVATAKSILISLKNLGVSIALDDFGIGYSSLQHLSELPFDALKIDRSFVKSMNDSKHALMIVKAILQLAKNLGLEVIAEGIETEDHALTLRGLGCEHGQGFYFGCPVPGVDLAPGGEQMEERATFTLSRRRDARPVPGEMIANSRRSF